MTWATEIAGYREEVRASFGVFRRSPHEALLWTTVVVAVLVVTLDDEVATTVRDTIESYHAERRMVYRRSGRISRNPRGWTRWSGCIEIDLICPKIARLCSPTKASLLAEFGVDVTALRSDQQVLVLHEHALVDHRGHDSAEALKRDLRAAWPGPRRVNASELHETGTLAENVARLANYSTKFCFRHSIAWNGRKTQYLGDYKSEWREYVKNLYTTIGIHKLLESNIATQSNAAVAGRRMYAGPTKSVDESNKNMPVQLCISNDNQSEQQYNLHNLHNDTKSSRDDGDTMRAHEIIKDYIDPRKISDETYAEIVDALDRIGANPASPRFIQLMYADERDELELEQLRLDLKRTQAEVGNLEAEAARDRAATRRALATVKDDEE